MVQLKVEAEEKFYHKHFRVRHGCVTEYICIQLHSHAHLKSVFGEPKR